MVKTTKKVTGTDSMVMFQRRDFDHVNSITLSGKDSLSDVTIDRGDATLSVLEDPDKINTFTSRVPFIDSVTYENNPKKDTIISQDLTKFKLESVSPYLTVRATKTKIELGLDLDGLALAVDKINHPEKYREGGEV